MSDQDLIDRLATSAHRADAIQLNPADLITAGRRRIHRRRVTAAASAILTLAAAVAVTLTGIRTTAEGQPEVAGNSPAVQQTLLDDPLTITLPEFSQLSVVMRKHLGPAEPRPGAMVFSASSRSIKVSATDGTVAVLRVVDPRTNRPGEVESPDVCRIAGELSTFTSCSITTFGGHQLRTGQRDDRAYFASTTRADGSLVMALLDKDANAPRIGVQPALFFADLTVSDLAALVTDPDVPKVR
ncbi:hypothetical protein [Kribbella lupini]|uniref:DUF5642 domain-containing protein n=1 Tax=Kribbella lupini TaxID=291602 RepID=A0ABN2AQ77_9ACTN